MRTFILLSTLTPQGVSNLRRTPDRLLEVNREVEAYGGRVIRQWALLGPYDFLTVVEAPDALTISRISTELSARGSASFETMVAIPGDELIEALGEPRTH